MAANKFATMLHKNSHKLTVILVYALLEWILIILLLLNSVFTYFITKFACYFGLKPPCLWCSRIDHVLEPQNSNTNNSYRNLVCETHANEISKLGFCSKHQRLAETENMCMDCLGSRPNHNDVSFGITRRIGFISWASTETLENDEKLVFKKCSCCNESLNNNLYSPYLLFKPSWKALSYTQKGNLIIEAIGDDCNGNEFKLLSKIDSIETNNDGGEEEVEEEEHQMLSDFGSFGLKDSAEEEECLGSELSLQCDEKEENQDQKEDSKEKESYGMNFVHQLSGGENSSAEITNLLHLERNLECEFHRLIPIELIDSTTCANLGSVICKEEDLEKHDLHQDQTSDSSLQNETQVKPSFVEDESMVINMEETMEKVLAGDACEQVFCMQIKVADKLPAQDKKINDHTSTNGNDAEISNETYIAHTELDLNSEEQAAEKEEDEIISADKNQEMISQHSSIRSECNEAEEEKFPETPTSVDSYHYLQKKLLLYEKRESGTEESFDGSVVSEIEGGDLVLTVEKLKTALKVERKTLNALYTELEEERSASAIAANQTMAMINRLQEEKAAMQMEALQYQRMMDEQSEYDQEALQLLNELMMKREREKQELEKELEVYRKKVFDYEAKEKMRMMRRSRDGSVRSRNSSATCSNTEDTDELSIDLNREAGDEDGSISIFGNQDSSNNNSPGEEVINLEEIALDCVKQISALDDSLAEFEEERLSILDQLKALEEKLLALHENELNEDGFDETYELSTPEENEISNELSKDKHYIERKTMGSMAKSLLPLLDAADNETEEGLAFEENVESEFVEMENVCVPKLELDSKKLALEDEVEHVYERLQALEADREFLKHCMSSIKKGDKGMDLLQEILQHLRDLRAVELRVKNVNDDPLG